MVVCVMACLITTFKVVSADETRIADENRVENYISSLYRQINFSQSNPLDYEVFDKAVKGYINLKNAGKLGSDKDVISICNFNLSSTENRLWIIDLAQKKVLFNTYVAHGQGSGEEFATHFSNKENSHQSSLGFYVTAETYQGEHGTSLRLQGMDQGFNDAALDRGIVVHGAEYVSSKFVNSQDRLGRSWGCPAVPTALSLPIINAIKGGTCLFIYRSDAKYNSSAYWMNKKVAYLPETDALKNMTSMEMQPKVKTIEYVHNGKVDSVKTVAMQ